MAKKENPDDYHKVLPKARQVSAISKHVYSKASEYKQ
jgi:hypothetical protein